MANNYNMHAIKYKINKWNPPPFYEELLTPMLEEENHGRRKLTSSEAVVELARTWWVAWFQRPSVRPSVCPMWSMRFPPWNWTNNEKSWYAKAYEEGGAACNEGYHRNGRTIEETRLIETKFHVSLDTEIDHRRYVALVVVLWCPALSSLASVTALRWEPVGLNVHV